MVAGPLRMLIEILLELFEIETCPGWRDISDAWTAHDPVAFRAAGMATCTEEGFK